MRVDDRNDRMSRERTFERVLPTGGAGIVVNLRDDELRTYDDAGTLRRASGAILSGPHTRPRVIDTEQVGAMVHVSFERGGVAGLIGTAAADIADTMVDLDAILGRDGANLRDRLLEARSARGMVAIVDHVLLEHVRVGDAPDGQMAQAVALLGRGALVRDVSSAVGISTKHLARRFRQHLGMSPKRYARIQRLQRVIAAVHGGAPDWSAVAAKHGYFDQAHLINDFRDLTGLTPTAYVATATAHANHVAFLQSPAPAAP